MAYNEKLADRVRMALSHQKSVEEKKMMGGLTFMVNGKMCVGVSKDELMVRLDPVIYDTALKRKGCREMNFTGKPMKGFVFVSPKGTSNKKDLNYWIGLALDFNKKAKSVEEAQLVYNPKVGLLISLSGYCCWGVYSTCLLLYGT